MRHQKNARLLPSPLISVYGKPMPAKMGRGPVDQPTRDRIAAWVRYTMKERQITSIRQFAGRIGLSHGYVARVLNGEVTPGLEFVLRLTRRMRINADVLLNDDPPSTVRKPDAE